MQLPGGTGCSTPRRTSFTAPIRCPASTPRGVNVIILGQVNKKTAGCGCTAACCWSLASPAAPALRQRRRRGEHAPSQWLTTDETPGTAPRAPASGTGHSIGHGTEPGAVMACRGDTRPGDPGSRRRDHGPRSPMCRSLADMQVRAAPRRPECRPWLRPSPGTAASLA